MKTSTMIMTLLEMLEHLKELADNGMQNSLAFNQSLDLYTQQTYSSDLALSEIEEAISFLKENSIGTLNTENMIEFLEGYTIAQDGNAIESMMLQELHEDEKKSAGIW